MLRASTQRRGDSGEASGQTLAYLDALRTVLEQFAEGDIPADMAMSMFSTTGFAFAKPDGGIRPVACGVVLRRLAFRAIVPAGTITWPTNRGPGLEVVAERIRDMAMLFLKGKGRHSAHEHYVDGAVMMFVSAGTVHRQQALPTYITHPCETRCKAPEPRSIAAGYLIFDLARVKAALALPMHRPRRTVRPAAVHKDGAPRAAASHTKCALGGASARPAGPTASATVQLRARHHSRLRLQ